MRGILGFVVVGCCVAAGVLEAESGSGGALCPEGDVDLTGLSPEDESFLEDFEAARELFSGMTLEQFTELSGPRKSYVRGPGGFVRGDAGGDGGLDISDPIATLLYIFLGKEPGAGPMCEDALDADDSGAIDITDPIYSLQYLFSGGPAPPEPFPTAGEDPTADTHSCDREAFTLGYEPLQAEYLAQITGRFPLTPAQEEAYRQNGFVILDTPYVNSFEGVSRKYYTFFEALNEIHRAELPVYISTDTILDALHVSFDEILKDVEEQLLVGELDSMLAKMEAGIPGLTVYSPTEEELDWVDFWICTARSLLSGAQQACTREVGATVTEFLGYVEAEAFQQIEIFGVLYPPGEPEDFSQFRPRAHYTETETLRRYFQAMMWVQRIGMRFAECRNHASVAFLLTRLLYDSGAVEGWLRINGVVEALAGKSDSLNPPDLTRLLEESSVDSLEEIRSAEGFEAFVRTAIETGAGRQLINSQVLRSNPGPDGFTPIPPVFQLMGQRFLVDSYVFTNVVHDRVPDRRLPSPLDAWFVLGNDAALPLLRGELERYHYQAQLAALRWVVSGLSEGGGAGGLVVPPSSGYSRDFWSSSLYNVWVDALRSLQVDTTRTPYPTVMRTLAWDRRVLQTQLASWAQLRHDLILYGKQSYTQGDCHYPDGWVDPYPELYMKLSDLGERTLVRLEALGILDRLNMYSQTIRKFFEGLRDHGRTLSEIAQAELEGLELTEEQTAFLKATLKQVGHHGSGPAPYDGWYIHVLYPYLKGMAPDFKPTVADVHTDPLTGQILHVAVGYPDLMVLSVKNDCGVRSYVGPVLSYYEFVHDQRMTDEEWLAVLKSEEVPARPSWTGDFAR